MASTASTSPSPQNEHAAHAPHKALGESPLHEGSNIHLRPLIKFTIWFAVALFIVHLIILWIFFAFRSASAQERQITGVSAPRIAPPSPRLQPSLDHNRLPVDDLRDMQVREAEELKRLGLIDEKGRPQFSDALVKQIAAQAVNK